MTENNDLAILWDLDGTLADTEQAHYVAWQSLCRDYGRELSWDEFKPTFGLGNSDILHMLIDQALEEPDLEQLSRRKEALFREGTGGMVAAMPGALALVAHLQALGIQQAIASSAPMENITFVLQALGLQGTFAALVSRWQVPRGKPFPDIFLRAAEEVHTPPGRCVVLEDAPAGVQAGKAAGMRTIALISTWPEQALAAADLRARDMRELLWTREEWEVFATKGVRAGETRRL